MHSLLQRHKKIVKLAMMCIEKLVFIDRHINSLDLTIEKNGKFSVKKEIFFDCVEKIFSLLVLSLASYKDSMESDEKIILNELNCIIDTINKLQDELTILPKYEARVELYRFLRIFDKDGIASLDDNKINFVLYPGESNKELKIFENTPLEHFEKTTLRDCYRIITKSEGPGPQASKGVYHISIPREEIELSLYWPLLAHEVGHQVMTLRLFHKRNISASLSNYLGVDADNKFSPAFQNLINRMPSDEVAAAGKEEILTAWLTECWCDIYGYFATGPAFIFAQRNSFVSKGISSDYYGSVSHPPHYLRLLVLNTIANNHQTNLFNSAEGAYSPLDSELSDLLIDCDQDLQNDIYDTAQWFSDFFNDHFKMETSGTANLHEHIKKLKSLLNDFDISSFDSLIQRINGGYPIPSLRISENLHERETSVHEIMMAAWCSHDTFLTDEVIKSFSDNFESYRIANDSERWTRLTKEIAPIFEKFNQSILRSLQVSEWVSLFRSKEQSMASLAEEYEEEKSEYVKSLSPSILVDHQIRELLKLDELKVLPLINIDAQLGSTSLDVRLGTTFQIYQPNQSGVIDFRLEESVQGAQNNSTVKDLDYKEGLVLAPGQFVLAHTLEYIGLPESVGAQLEGRSSFARLGIQIHMTASFIDPGFHGSITFEIYNAGPNPIRLFPGYRIGQLRFFPCNKPNKPYNKKKHAKYKGLLGHSSSLLRNDYEIDCLED